MTHLARYALSAMLLCLLRGWALSWALAFALAVFFVFGLRRGYGATALAAGTFATAAAYTYGIAAEGAEKLFDGNTSTKCNMTTSINRNDPSTWRVITMRLADGASIVNTAILTPFENEDAGADEEMKE